jgi:hypothetical protein
MHQLRITRRRAARPTSSEAEPLTEDLRTSSGPGGDAGVVATLAHIDEVLCGSR